MSLLYDLYRKVKYTLGYGTSEDISDEELVSPEFLKTAEYFARKKSLPLGILYPSSYHAQRKRESLEKLLK